MPKITIRNLKKKFPDLDVDSAVIALKTKEGELLRLVRLPKNRHNPQRWVVVEETALISGGSRYRDVSLEKVLEELEFSNNDDIYVFKGVRAYNKVLADTIAESGM